MPAKFDENASDDAYRLFVPGNALRGAVAHIPVDYCQRREASSFKPGDILILRRRP